MRARHWLKISVFGFVLSTFLSCQLWGEIPTSAASTSSTTSSLDGFELQTEDALSWKFPELALEDLGELATSPSCFDEQRWFETGLALMTVASVGAFLDRPVRHTVLSTDSVWRRKLARDVSRFGSNYLIGVIGGLEAAGIGLEDQELLATAHDAFLATVIANGAVTSPLKFAVGRRRPTEGKGDFAFRPFSKRYAFPSGHTTQAFAAAASITEHYDAPWVDSVAYGLATLVGISMLELDAHYTSDVVAGAIIGQVVGKAVTRFNTTKRVQLSLGASRSGAQVEVQGKF